MTTIILVLAGVVKLLVSYLVVEQELKVGYAGVDAGIISIVLGFPETSLSKKSADKMADIANWKLMERVL
jgi:hypothetical protein